MIDANSASILIALIGGGFGVWSAVISSKNQKATKDITAVLANTKTPVDSLDQVIKLLQDQLSQTSARHDRERAFFSEEIHRVRLENENDRDNWEKSEQKLQAEIDKLIAERIALLDQIRGLKDQLADLERKVQHSLDEIEESPRIKDKARG